jgi:hypothetical protein
LNVDDTETRSVAGSTRNRLALDLDEAIGFRPGVGFYIFGIRQPYTALRMYPEPEPAGRGCSHLPGAAGRRVNRDDPSAIQRIGRIIVSSAAN